MDFAPPFQMAHPKAFQLAEEVAKLMPAGLNRVFFTNSGSESVETALKMALAYHRVRGEGQRTRLIGRERATTASTSAASRWAAWWPIARCSGRCSAASTTSATRTTWPATHSRWDSRRMAPNWPTNLERLVALHDASTIAAVIVEPVAGSTGVLIPPRGYLQRLREICDKHGILLIFDEVITGFGRTGQPFAAQTSASRPT